jgi:flagellar assembly protein FliH
MPTVIRVNQQQRGAHQSEFNFEDMAAQANRYLDKVRADAAQIVSAARREADAIRQQAAAEGRAEGQRAIQQLVQEQLAQQTKTLMPALRVGIDQIGHARQAWLAHWERVAIHLAAAIAKRVIRRELTRQPEVPTQLVREALELAAGSSHLRIHLNPADHQVLAGEVQTLAKELAALATCEIIANPDITAGGCRLETQFGVIDQQVESQLARIEEELT